MFYWLLDFQNALITLSEGIRPLYKIGDTYYASISEKSQPMSWLKYFSDGLLMPGHIRQSLYNVTNFLRQTGLSTNDSGPFFTEYYSYGFRIIYGNQKTGLISVVTTNNRFLIRLAKYFYPNIADIYNNLANRNKKAAVFNFGGNANSSQ